MNDFHDLVAAHAAAQKLNLRVTAERPDWAYVWQCGPLSRLSDQQKYDATMGFVQHLRGKLDLAPAEAGVDIVAAVAEVEAAYGASAA